MTDERKDPRGKNREYKQVYIKSNRLKPYTSAFIGEDDYLQTNVWLRLRRERLIIDLYRCARCGTAHDVQVHHIRYPDVWGEENIEADLITLCDRCHAEVHSFDIADRDMPF